MVSKTEVKDPSEWINRFTADVSIVLKALHESDPNITTEDIQEALTQALGLDNTTELLYQDLPAKRILALLEKYDFSAFHPETLAKVSFKDSIIPISVSRFLTEQEVKIKGEIWTIHKNDADPFPSNPHAHNYPEHMVAHLGNGKLYRDRKEIGQLNKKKLLRLRDAITNVELPPLLR